MDLPSLSTLLTWHLIVPTLSMLLTWQDSGGCAHFVNGSHLVRQWWTCPFCQWFSSGTWLCPLCQWFSSGTWLCPLCQWFSPGTWLCPLCQCFPPGCAHSVNGSHLAPGCAHPFTASHLARQWWTCPLFQWFSPGKTVVDMPTLSMVLTWQDSGGRARSVNVLAWHLIVPTLSMLPT